MRFTWLMAFLQLCNFWFSRFVRGFGIGVLALPVFAQTPTTHPRPSPSRLSVDFLQSENFVEYRSPFGELSSPLARRLRLNEEMVTDPRALFSEKFFISLPPGTQITVRSLPTRKTFAFPLGTRIVHEMRFRDDEKTLFETRMVSRESEEAWSFGTYFQQGAQLILLPAAEEEVIRRENLRSGREEWRIDFLPLPQAVCARCHQGIRESITGVNERPSPCSFTPENEWLDDSWQNKFREQVGHLPFLFEGN